MADGDNGLFRSLESVEGGSGRCRKECADACRAEGIGFGIYVSPGTGTSRYADPQQYDDFYCRQLEELLSGYGPLVEIWFDGAGSEGREYDWPRIMDLVKGISRCHDV